MGGCASVEKYANSVKKLVIPSPVKDGSPISLDRPIGDREFKSQWTPTQPVTTAFRDLGSKEDAFFESQAWLDSDCEDDFFSVKGDFTPSRGNTPVHHSFSKGGPGTPGLNILSSPFNGNLKLAMDSSKPSPSPSPLQSPTDGKKKMLLELFRESIGGDQDLLDKLLGTKTHEGEMTPIKSEIKPERRIPVKSHQCCFPRISPRGTKKTSPVASM